MLLIFMSKRHVPNNTMFLSRETGLFYNPITQDPRNFAQWNFMEP